MDNCPTCGQLVDGLSAGVVDKLVNWDDWDYSSVGDSEDYNGLGVVELLVEPKSKDYDSYGGIAEEDVFIVVKVEGRLFKKEGYRNSYGTLDWNGSCREVKSEPRTITVYDYVV